LQIFDAKKYCALAFLVCLLLSVEIMNQVKTYQLPDNVKVLLEQWITTVASDVVGNHTVRTIAESISPADGFPSQTESSTTLQQQQSSVNTSSSEDS
jgi:hypothetical protein